MYSCLTSLTLYLKVFVLFTFALAQIVAWLCLKEMIWLLTHTDQLHLIWNLVQLTIRILTIFKMKSWKSSITNIVCKSTKLHRFYKTNLILTVLTRLRTDHCISCDAADIFSSFLPSSYGVYDEGCSFSNWADASQSRLVNLAFKNYVKKFWKINEMRGKVF